LQILSNPDRVTREKKQVTFLTKSTANFAIHLHSLQIKFVPGHLWKVSRPKCHAKADKNLKKLAIFMRTLAKHWLLKKEIDRNRLQKLAFAHTHKSGICALIVLNHFLASNANRPKDVPERLS